MKNAAEIIRYKAVTSTNDIAKKMILEGAVHGTTVVADMQENGRGRQGRTFFSPLGGVYMTVIVKFCHGDGGISKNEAAQKNSKSLNDIFGNTTVPVTKLTIVAAVAVADALKSALHIEAGIKWVNDIFFEGRKVGGILTETVGDGAVVGIGINLRTEKLSADLPNAGSLLSVAGAVTTIQMVEVIQKQLLDTLSDFDSKIILDKYRRKSVLLGKRVLVTAGGKEYEAEVKDIDDDGGLVVRRDNGVFVTLTYGEANLLIR